MTRGPLGLTCGDPSGIGPDITLTAWADRTRNALPAFCVYADPEALRSRAARLKLQIPISVIENPSEAAACFSTALPVINIPLHEAAVVGEPGRANAPSVVASIDRAVTDVRAGVISAIVTNPIAKSVLYDAGFRYPGHTEYLGALALRHWPGFEGMPMMMLVGGDLRVVPLTIHVPIERVPRLITANAIIAALAAMDASLTHDFGIAKPRIAVAGLNPHAGEGGSIGAEDRDVIAPAIAAVAKHGLNVSGPHSADTLFHAAASARYDAVLAMYHDQALIPVKTLAFETGVNVTLALPFVRTSPDHGTAFDIAGTGAASASSLIAALKLADQMATRRSAFTAKQIAIEQSA